MFDIHNVFDESKINNFNQNGIASVFTIRAKLSLCGNTNQNNYKKNYWSCDQWSYINISIILFLFHINKRIVIM